MKIVVIIARIIFVVCLPVLLLTAVIAGEVNSSWLYTHGFEKYDVRQSLADNGLNPSNADMAGIARGFIHYFNSNQEYINLTVQQNNQTVNLFNNEEIIHFKDVKKLFTFDYEVLLGTLSYCLCFGLVSFFWKKDENRKKLARDTIKGSVLTLGLMLLLGIGTLVDFNNLFYQFHLLVFTNSFWSAEGNMLLLFPDGFWYDAAIYIVISIALLAIILGVLSWIYLNHNKRKEQKNRLL
jgi:integral membrane protein (TIGR01906 family)